jgi:tyrosinase
MIVAKPTWDNDIKDLFAAPCWVPENKRATVAVEWHRCMKGYSICLDKPDSVKEWSVTIYNHLASRAMPLTTDQDQFWPDKALETFRLRVNQGWRIDANAHFDKAERIPGIYELGRPPPPGSPLTKPYIRPDIRSLCQDEINIYRARFDDVMDIGNPDPGTLWQRFAYIHTNWCLHYQEAFAFWHRAYLLFLEALIDHPIPYWDWMAEHASVDGNPEAGLPQAYLDETYIHPETGEERLNPLRYAAAKDGKSKLCALGMISVPQCRYVQRNPLFYTSGDDQRQAREKLYDMARLFQQQVVVAQKFETFSKPQGDGFPWANLPSFEPPQPDKLYPYREVNFDGLFEQPHDNYHGWIGADMADNAYTAFDPIFFSYHSNIDRMLEVWIRAHPTTQYSAKTLLQPFLGADARAVNFATPDASRYTSIGAMALDSRRIGYDYGPPVAKQFQGGPNGGEGKGTRAAPNGAGARPASPEGERSDLSGPWVVFDGVRCTHDSYLIDVFLDQPDAEAEDARADNPHFVGRFSRIGMGIEDDKGRCIQVGVSRALNAAHTAAALGLASQDDPKLSVIVTHIDGDRVLPRLEYARLPGFVPELVWGDPRQPMTGQPTDAGGCCETLCP